MSKSKKNVTIVIPNIKPRNPTIECLKNCKASKMVKTNKQLRRKEQNNKNNFFKDYLYKNEKQNQRVCISNNVYANSLVY